MLTCEEELEKTKQELETLRQEFQDFAYAASHDLSAPFRHISGFVEIISRNNSNSFDEETKTHFNYIIQGTKEGVSLLGGLLEFSRLNTNVKPSTQLAMKQPLDDAMFQLMKLIKQTNTKVEVSNLPNITADQEQITQVFYHLLKNAILYRNDKTAPLINISVEDINSKIENKTKDKVEGNRKEWLFCIKDNGMGISSHQLENIFKPLKRAVGNSYEGVGMGLAITKKIITKHGGKIWAQSDKDLGSSFYFTLPKTI